MLFKIIIDDIWLVMLSVIVFSEIYDGEVLDCVSEVDVWNLVFIEWLLDRIM